MYISKSKGIGCHSDTASIFTVNNPYGYRININHPRIMKAYAKYLENNAIPPWCPLSDEQRYEFENMIFEWQKLEKPHKQKEST